MEEMEEIVDLEDLVEQKMERLLQVDLMVPLLEVHRQEETIMIQRVEEEVEREADLEGVEEMEGLMEEEMELVLQVGLMVPLLEVHQQEETIIIQRVEEEVDLEEMEELEDLVEEEVGLVP